MRIIKLILQGISYRRTIEFNDGLTIISGDKTSGKSLVLSLIDYCLGKSQKIDLKVQRELNEYCDQLFLEIDINGDNLTINRPLKEKFDKINVYFCVFEKLNDYTPKVVDRDELMNLLMRKLNINEYKLIKHQKHSNKQELEQISFRDVFRYVYIHQHELGTHDFLSNKSTFKRYKNPHTFKLIFGLIDQDKDALKQQLVDAKNRIDETIKEIAGLKSYLKDKDAEIYLELWNKSNEFESEINKRKEEKSSIISNGKNNKNSENEMYIELKKELTEIANQIFQLQRQKKDLLISQASKNLLKKEYEEELVETDATIEINYKLIIPEHNMECPLCQSKIHHTHQGINTVGTLNKIKKDIISKIKMITKMISNESELINKIELSINRWRKKEDILNVAIKEFTKLTEVPFLSQIDSINSMINKLSREREITKECLRLHHKIAEKEKQISDLESEIKRLETELSKLQVSETYKEEVFDFLNKQYKEFMQRFKYDTNQETYISEETFIPYYRGSSVYEHESGGLLLCMQLSFLATILKGKSEGYATGHPGILMLDSLSKYLGTIRREHHADQSETLTETSDKNLINDPEVYDEIYKILKELSQDFQIIIVENTPPETVDSFTKYTFLSGEKGLVNDSVNEFKEEE